MHNQALCVFWFRRDLRLNDNNGLHKALSSGYKVLPLFIFDRHILDDLKDPADQRVHFIWKEIKSIKEKLEKEHDSSMLVFHSTPEEVFKDLVERYNIQLVVANRDYEPYAIQRDKKIYEFLKERGIDFKGYKDQVLLDRNEVLKGDGKPYTVYTPYMRKYRDILTGGHFQSHPSEDQLDNLVETGPLEYPGLEDMGFKEIDFEFPFREFDEEIIRNYHNTRNIPAVKGTTRLSMHLRFGTVSIRELARLAQKTNTKFFNELIWRDFYQMILYHFPHIITESFKPKYDRIEWENKEEHFERWKEGTTGYPIVDAGMRELNQSGYMHNRVRMIVASFLTKHLLIDWRWGEAYFAEKLLDYEAGSNVGGWQWAAGSGVDAAPYFRVFNPYLQLEKFDPSLEYVKRWVSEYGTDDYPEPIVEHKFARERALDRFKKALN